MVGKDANIINILKQKQTFKKVKFTVFKIFKIKPLS